MSKELHIAFFSAIAGMSFYGIVYWAIGRPPLIMLITFCLIYTISSIVMRNRKDKENE